MRTLKSYDVLETIIDEANKRFSPLWKQSLEKTEALKSFCESVDSFIDKTNAETLEVEIDEITMEIMMSVKGSTASAEFITPGIWDRI